MNISFTKEQEKYIKEQVSSGDFQNNSEVIRDALRLHKTFRAKLLDDLKLEIEKGWQAPDSSKTLKQIISSKKQIN